MGDLVISEPLLAKSAPLLLPEGEAPFLGSAKRTFGNVVVSIIGAGVLGLPYTFSRSGWALGTFSICSSACVSYYCMILLVRCRQRLGREGHRGIHSYGDLGQHAYGEAGQRAVDALVLFSQGGCCVAYLLFIGQNISSIVNVAGASKATCILLLAPFQVLLAWVRSLAGLAPFSIFADVANILAMAMVIKDDLGSFKDFSEVLPFTGWGHVPFAMGLAIYCYEGFSMTLPLEASMKNRDRFPGILGLAMVCITMLYVAFGLIGYLAYGDATEEIITLNLPNDWSTVAVKLGLCIGLFFTFPVMMHPVHEIFERRLSLFKSFQSHIEPHPHLKNATFKLIRLTVVLLAALLAVEVPGFATLCSILGATVCALLAFVLPAIFHMHIFWKDLYWLEFAIDCLLVLIGVAFALYGTYNAVQGVLS